MLPAFHVPTSAFGLCAAAAQSFNCLAYANEYANPTAYSKFSKAAAAGGATMLGSQAGMLAIYVPPAAVSALALATAPVANGREGVVALLLLVHFAKRIGEVLCVHRYSGQMVRSTAGFIGAFYSLVVLIVVSQQRAVPASVYTAATLPAALGLYTVGQAGNLLHHQLLARMRTTSEAKKPAYSIPTGGLFGLCATPHYAFEVLAWLGIALAAQQLNALLAALGMASYLAGRAVATSRWYREQFGEAWPSSRKHMVPFVF